MSCMIHGDPSSELMIIGMSPGREELRTNEPFIGSSGHTLWVTAADAGFSKADSYIVNTIGELPLGTVGKKRNAKILPDQYAKYWDRFEDAVSAFTGSVVLCLGGNALWRYTAIGNQVAPISKWRGYLIDLQEDIGTFKQELWVSDEFYKTSRKLPDGSWKYRKGDPKPSRRTWVTVSPTISSSVKVIIPTVHPAYVQYSGFKPLPAFNADISRVGRALRRELMPEILTFVEYPVFEAGTDMVSADIENHRETKAITRIGLGTIRNICTLPWDATSRALAQKYLSDPNRLKIFWNEGHDIPILEAHGVTTVEPCWDGMIAAHMIQPDLFKGLKPTASMYMDLNRWDHTSEDKPAEYNAWDVHCPLRMQPMQEADLKATGQYGLFTKTIQPTLRTFMRMTQFGIRVDRAYRARWTMKLQQQLSLARHEWETLTPGINYRSVPVLGRYLYEERSMPAQYEGNSYTTNKEALQNLLECEITEHDRKIVNCLLILRRDDKSEGTYASRIIADDGRVHPRYLPGAKDFDELGRKGMAGTGRPTARSPNIQNVPQDARGMYIPDEGFNLWSRDYRSAELVVAAHLSGDKAMMEAVKGDFHAYVGNGLTVDNRGVIKIFVYGTMYGAGADILVQQAKQRGYALDRDGVETMQRGFAKLFPYYWGWRQDIIREVKKNHALSNAFGRHRFFHGGEKQAPAALDFPPQSCVADIIWEIQRDLESAFKDLGGNNLAIIHDEILYQLPPGKDDIQIKSIMEQKFPQISPTFRLETALKSGPNWGAMEEIVV